MEELRKSVESVFDSAYRSGYIGLLAATRLIGSLDISVPSKWLNVFEGVKASSNLAHSKLSTREEKLMKEYLEMESLIEKRVGRDTFYSEEELEILKTRKDSIDIGR